MRRSGWASPVLRRTRPGQQMEAMPAGGRQRVAGSRRRVVTRGPVGVVAAALAVLLALAACSSGGSPHPTPSAASPSAAARPGAAATTAPASAQSGLGWASGANGNFPADVNAWATWTGRPVDVAVVFTNRVDWPNITTASWPVGAFTRAAFPGQLSVAQPLFPQDGNEAACARGEYDSHWSQFGQTLTKYGRGDAYVRLGWEFNGSWFWWYVRDPQAWKTCFQRAVTAIRSTAPKVRIEWTMTAHQDTLPHSKIDVWAAYPGDDYVDVVSVDAYDFYPASTDQTSWDRQCHQRSGLCTVADFARAHGKALAVPEWGVAHSNSGGGDNPFLVEKMHEFFTQTADILAYEAYYNNSEADNVRSSLNNPDLNPRSARRYLDLFGRSG
jgi:hypothetical protein